MTIEKRATILILDDATEGSEALQRALSADYNIALVPSIAKAMKMLQASDSTFDMIICGVHLENENIFDFLKLVKSKKQCKSIPFLCFRWGYTDFAKAADSTIERACHLLGAAGYIAITDATATDTTLKSRVEAILKPSESKRRRSSENAKH